MFNRGRGNGTQVILNPLLVRTTDTSLSLKDPSDVQRDSPSRYTNELIQSCLRKTLNDQKSEPGLDSVLEGFYSKDTLKMEPIAQLTRRKFKASSYNIHLRQLRTKTFLVDYKSKLKKRINSAIDCTSKRQQGEITEMNSVLKKVLELQISIVQELQGKITAELRNGTHQKFNMKFKCE
jgi:hypothetical protein